MKNRKIKRLIASIMVSLIVITFVPINSTIAQEIEGSTKEATLVLKSALKKLSIDSRITPKANAARFMYNIYYETGTKTLALTFTGDMPSYLDTASPWDEYKDYEHLIIRGDSRYIGVGAFKDFTKLKDVVFESNIKSLYGNCFENCTSLEKIEFPESLQYISSYAFKDCTSIENIEFPEKFVGMSLGAFQNCTGLKNIVIPDNIKYIMKGAFSGCHPETLKTPFIGGGPENTNEYKSDQLGYIFGTTEYENTSAVKSLVEKGVNYYVPNSLKEVTVTKNLYENNLRLDPCVKKLIIAETVADKAIPAYFAMNSTGLEEVVLNDNINAINKQAFYKCPNLRKIDLPSSISRILPHAFNGCVSLSEITFPQKYINIRYNAFKDAKFINDSEDDFVIVGNGMLIWYKGSDTNVVVPDTVNSISGAFVDNATITSINLPDTLKQIGQCSFIGCTGITELSIPESVVHIENGALYGMCNLERLEIPYVGKNRTASDNSKDSLFSSLFSSADSKCISCKGENCYERKQSYGANNRYSSSYTYYISKKFKEVTITGGQIKTNSFYGEKSIKNINIGKNVESVDSRAFYKSYIQNVSFEEDVQIETLPSLCFGDCKNLTSFKVPSSVKSIEGAFNNSGLESITLNDGLEKIRGSAFADCTGLTFIEIGPNVDYINTGAFLNSGIEMFEVSSDNPYYFTSYGILYNKDGGLYIYPPNNNETVLRIGKNVTSISSQVLDAMPQIESIWVEKGNMHFKVIDGVLYDFDVTKLIKCPKNKTGDYVSPATVTYVGYRAFYNCKSLNKIEFTNKKAEFHKSCFDNSFPVELIVPNLPEKLSYYFGYDPEYDDEVSPNRNKRFKKLKLTNQTDDISVEFAYLHDIEEISITGSFSTIREKAFWGGCFEEITIPSTVRDIEYGAFNQAKLKYLYGGENIEFIGRSAFESSDLCYFKMPQTLVTLESFAFAGTDLTEIVLYENLKEVGYHVFGETKIKKAVINESLVSLSDELFANCKDLEIVVVGGAVETIGAKSFAGCSSLEAVIIPDNVTEIESDAFSNVGENLVIYCNEGSSAQKYAKNNNIKYTTLVLDAIPNQTYTGSEIKPTVGAKANDRVLSLNSEYTLSYSDNINVGVAKVVARGLGDFKHLVATGKFNILGRQIEDTVIATNYVKYDPAGVEPDIKVYWGNKQLTYGIDYEYLNYDETDDVGTYNITIKGIGNFSGTYNTTYNITPYNIYETTIITDDCFAVMHGDYKLVEGRDYIIDTITEESGKRKNIIIGIGNYTGTSVISGEVEIPVNFIEKLIIMIMSILEKLLAIG